MSAPDMNEVYRRLVLAIGEYDRLKPPPPEPTEARIQWVATMVFRLVDEVAVLRERVDALERAQGVRKAEQDDNYRAAMLDQMFSHHRKTMFWSLETYVVDRHERAAQLYPDEDECRWEIDRRTNKT